MRIQTNHNKIINVMKTKLKISKNPDDKILSQTLHNSPSSKYLYEELQPSTNEVKIFGINEYKCLVPTTANQYSMMQALSDVDYR